MKKNFFHQSKRIDNRYNGPIERIEEEIISYSDPTNPKAIALVSKVSLSNNEFQLDVPHTYATMLRKGLEPIMPYDELDQLEALSTDASKFIIKINMGEHYCSIEVTIVTSRELWSFVFIPVK